VTAKRLSEYKDKFTLDGRLKAPLGVSDRKVKRMKHLVESTLGGSFEARGQLQEAMSSTDAIFNYAHLLNINLLPQYDALEPTWRQIAGTRTVQDFRPAVLWSLVSRWNETERQGSDPTPNAAPHGIAPVVPEGGVYPYAYMSGDESQAGGIQKRGFKTDFTFEAFINDAVGFIQALPGEMLNVATDTQDYDTYQALLNGIDTTVQIAGGLTPDGSTVKPNAKLSRAAIIRAIYEVSQRKINNRYVKVNGWNLLVPVGQADYVNFWLNQSIAEIQNGSLELTVTGYNPLANVTVVESEWLNDPEWILVPKPGATRRPVLEYGFLAGHADPEVRIDGATGSYVGGAGISPFEGSFDNDSTTFRLRQIGGGILWEKRLIIWSDGSEVAH